MKNRIYAVLTVLSSDHVVAERRCAVGRCRPGNAKVSWAETTALSARGEHIYGDGCAGTRIAQVLADALLRIQKQTMYW